MTAVHSLIVPNLSLAFSHSFNAWVVRLLSCALVLLLLLSSCWTMHAQIVSNADFEQIFADVGCVRCQAHRHLPPNGTFA